jgi:sulfotransferase family protein
MSQAKELMFFTREDWRERVGWYESQFGPGRIRGESSPTYTMFPFLPSTAERIHELTPEARIIYLVRDPVERAIANYVELTALRLEDRPIDDALSDLADPANPHVCASRYATQLERFLDRFAPERILVIDHLDLLTDRAATLRETFRFLEIDENFTTPSFDRLHNARAVKVRYNRLGFWMVRHRILTLPRGPFGAGPLIQPLRGLLSSPIDTGLAPETRAGLVAALRPEVERLRELTGKPFARWPAFAVSAPG